MAAPLGGHASLPDLYKEAWSMAGWAVQADKERDFQVAILYYTVDADDAKRQHAKNKALEYISRAEELKEEARRIIFYPQHVPDVENNVQHAQFLFDQAVAADEKGVYSEAYVSYVAAAESFFRAFAAVTDDSRKVEIGQKLSIILSRAEELKNVPDAEKARIPSSPQPLPVTAPFISSGTSKLTPGEVEVLRRASFVNNKTYLPWLDIDVRERFWSEEPFVDPDGPLQLSAKQLAQFGGWKRPHQFMSKPKMIYLISSTSIIQDVVTDCSFVASLCVSATYERRFRKRLITACIYPKDRDGHPVYNPSGKYMVDQIDIQRDSTEGKAVVFFENVFTKRSQICIPRSSVVDDTLPISKDGTLMCTGSSNRNELWASIIEKAYMKLMGGYDFPGSNSGIDLYALTGWIPEHILFREKTFNPDKQWKRLLDGSRYGDALITIATGAITDKEANDWGLVPSHAYAGPFSHMDKTNWTPELRRVLNYDQLGALHLDDGIFWIDYASVCTRFECIHMNWNPELFSYRYVLHVSWPAHGPLRDNYNLGYNPQYGLEVDVTDEKGGAVWLLLSKHITVTEENSDYITMHVYASTNCERVYYPDNPMIKGTYINSPHVLTRFTAPPGKSRYTIVMSQHEKRKTLGFSLRVFAFSPFKIGEIPRKHAFETKMAGSWTGDTAGGSAAHATFINNPNYRIHIPEGKGQTGLFAMIEAPRDYPVNLKLFKGGQRVTCVSAENTVTSTGDFRHGFCYFDVPGLTGASFSDAMQNMGMHRKVIKGEWSLNVNAMGSGRSPGYFLNPQYWLDVDQPTNIKIRLQAPDMRPAPPLNISLFQRDGRKGVSGEVASSGPYIDWIQGVVIEDAQLFPGRGQ
ncbi:calpain 7 [Borealophlyctis nickersoniae]|nr:calpain 7 [Borealophlyctis nickersoniae]